MTIDPSSGALSGLKLNENGAELLGGPSNGIIAETVESVDAIPADYMPPRSMRSIVDSSGGHPVLSDVQYEIGQLLARATVVAVRDQDTR